MTENYQFEVGDYVRITDMGYSYNSRFSPQWIKDNCPQYTGKISDWREIKELENATVMYRAPALDDSSPVYLVRDNDGKYFVFYSSRGLWKG